MSLTEPTLADPITPQDAWQQAAERVTPFGEYLGAKATGAFEALRPVQAAKQALMPPPADYPTDEMRVFGPGGTFDVGSPPVGKAAYEASPDYRPGIPWDEGMTQARAAALATEHDRVTWRDSLVQRYQGGLGGEALGLAVTLGVGALDPTNYIPLLGPAAKAAMVARLGVIGGNIALHGAEAAANTALFEPLTAASAHQIGQPYGWQDAAADIVLGGLAGALGGAIHGGIKYRGSLREAATRTRLETVMAAADATSLAADQLDRGEAANVAPVLEGRLPEAPRPAASAGFVTADGARWVWDDGRARPEGTAPGYGTFSSADRDLFLPPDEAARLQGAGQRPVLVKRGGDYFAGNMADDGSVHVTDTTRLNISDKPSAAATFLRAQAVKASGDETIFSPSLRAIKDVRDGAPVARPSPYGMDIRVFDPQPDGSVSKTYRLLNEKGELLATAEVLVRGDEVRIGNVATPAGEAAEELGTGLRTVSQSLGTKAMLFLGREIARDNPEATRLTGERIGGARFGGEFAEGDKGAEASIALARFRDRPAAPSFATATPEPPPASVAEAAKRVGKTADPLAQFKQDAGLEGYEKPLPGHEPKPEPGTPEGTQPPNLKVKASGPLAQQIEAEHVRARSLADKLGITELVERLAYDGRTAVQIGKELADGGLLNEVDLETKANTDGTEGDLRRGRSQFVRMVRNTLDIPSMDDHTEFASWRQKYETREAAAKPAKPKAARGAITLPAEANSFEKPTDILINPTRADVGKLLRDASHGSRMLVDPRTGDLYAWEGDSATHSDVIKYLGIPAGPEVKDYLSLGIGKGHIAETWPEIQAEIDKGRAAARAAAAAKPAKPERPPTREEKAAALAALPPELAEIEAMRREGSFRPEDERTLAAGEAEAQRAEQYAAAWSALASCVARNAA